MTVRTTAISQVTRIVSLRMWKHKSHTLDGEKLMELCSVDSAYLKTVHWHRNLFKIPSGKADKAFVAEMARLLHAYAEASTLETVALKCIMTMPALLLQKAHQSSKAMDHVICLERRMKAWYDSDIEQLLHEGTIQSRFSLASWQARSEEQLARSFSKLMFEGKVKPAIHLLATHSRGGTLNLDSQVPVGDSSDELASVSDVLIAKHPKGQPVKASAVVKPKTTPQTPHPIMLEGIDATLIQSMALKTDGAAGPSGIDAYGWRRLLAFFQRESTALCEAVAMVARWICQQFVDPAALQGFTACRLVALDKCSCVWPIGIGEVLWRIIGKAILTITGANVQQATGALQMCAGQQAGCEAAIHAMRQIFEHPLMEAVLMVDASNAFNSLNRQVALRNILHICPSIAPAIINSYRSDSYLFIGGEVMHSSEGTTQGDPLAMVMYAIATLPLIRQLK